MCFSGRRKRGGENGTRHTRCAMYMTTKWYIHRHGSPREDVQCQINWSVGSPLVLVYNKSYMVCFVVITFPRPNLNTSRAPHLPLICSRPGIYILVLLHTHTEDRWGE